MKSDVPRRKQKKDKTVNTRWIVTIFAATVAISAVFSLVSSSILSTANLAVAFCVLLVIVFIGILFDIVGVAVTAADAKPFHSMAAHRVPGAQDALTMLRNAEKVSSFCNDVVGDICGVISGTASASLVVLMLSGQGGAAYGWVETGMAALVSGITVGGKAIGKSLAMTKSTQIVHTAAKAVYYVRRAPKAAAGVFRRRKK